MKTSRFQNILLFKLLLTTGICSCQNTKIEKLTDDTKNLMSLNYNLEKEKICDLNNDGKKDIILLYRSKNADEEIETLDFPVILLLSLNNDYVKIENKDILYSFIPNNSVLDYGLVTKNNFFTLEQTTGGGNNQERKYITFKFDQNKKAVFLYKYGIETTYPTKNGLNKKSQLYSTKDFGKIKFENVKEDLLEKIIN